MAFRPPPTLPRSAHGTLPRSDPRTWRGRRTARYADSVPDIAQQSRRQLASTVRHVSTGRGVPQSKAYSARESERNTSKSTPESGVAVQTGPSPRAKALI
eukprot:3295593-Rhodomonas_salina.2